MSEPQHSLAINFRHTYGRLVATLSRRAGVGHLAAIEDAVQFALMRAFETWARPGEEEPHNPFAWLLQVASNALTGELRTASRRQRILHQESQSHEPHTPHREVRLSGELTDDLLRMLLVCCDSRLPELSQVVLALKTLCGFDVPAIAQRLFISDANVYKRLARARERLRTCAPELDALQPQGYAAHVPSVHKVIYHVFTEGHLSSHPDAALRIELCDEALRLGNLLAEHPASAGPETKALLALMHLHMARLPARQSATGGLLLLEEQDRSQWDMTRVQLGLAWLADSATGDVLSRYHLEAAIAAEHCLAPTFHATCWERVVGYYVQLEQQSPAPLHTLNRAVALAEWRGPEAGLTLLQNLAPPSWLKGSYLWALVLADLHMRCGHDAKGQEYRRAALAGAPSAEVRGLMERRLSKA